MPTPKRLTFALASLMLAAGTALASAGPAAGASAAGATGSGLSAGFPSCDFFVCPEGTITNWASGECVAPVPDPDTGYAVNGLDIEQFDCLAGRPPSQTWRFIPLFNMTVDGQTRTVYHILNLAALKCLDDRDGKTSDRSPVQLWACNDTSTTMQWVLGDDLTSARQLLNLQAVQKGGSRCLDVAAGSLEEGAVLQLYHCTTFNEAQHFYEPAIPVAS
jgi:hypothetical protein